MTTTYEKFTEIKTAGGCVNMRGNESWAITTICTQSHLDVHPTECTILREHGRDTGMRYVMAAGQLVGSYRVLVAYDA